ncbi:hypothetical protein GTY65_30715 [Streptomyces sp. SID8379]|uniref:hypothetical protein n=1 Tax=unclassified Streptomyces TaxID=2593676 RepID=UPI000998B688|nr:MULTISPECIES: hypothetical protein [unclassified Streptomyces]MYW68415.1 hypothetical protein [Streptomyces sp. SID8379]
MAHKSPTEGWRDTITHCGLQLVSEFETQVRTSTMTAIYAATGVDVKPTARIPATSSRPPEELDQEWHEQALHHSLYADDQSFLIIPPGSGGSSFGWVKVKDPVGHSLPSRIFAATGNTDFVAISTDGRRLCAVTLEEDEYWVVTHEFA